MSIYVPTYCFLTASFDFLGTVVSLGPMLLRAVPATCTPRCLPFDEAYVL